MHVVISLLANNIKAITILQVMYKSLHFKKVGLHCVVNELILGYLSFEKLPKIWLDVLKVNCNQIFRLLFD